jgi:hypothetical protein
VATTQGTFFFVKNPNYVVATNIQWGSNNPKGAKVAMVMRDIKHDVWVTFKSKADTSRFIWRVANRSQAFDRYLADPKLLYKGELSFYYSNAVPSGVNVIDTTAYFKLIGRSHYNQ